MKWYVYELWDPINNEIFYVGKGTGNRAQKHYMYLREDDFSIKGNIIRRILKIGKIPKIKKVFYSFSETDAYAKEIELIAFYGKRVDAAGPLANITNGGTGGDTVSGQDPEKVKLRYKKRLLTIKNKTDEEKQASFAKRSKSQKLRWKNDYDNRRQAITNGIRENRDKDRHAKAVSDGWKKRSEKDKAKTAKKKSDMRKKLYAAADAEHLERLQRGAKSISIQVKIIKPTGEEFISSSLLSWCKENNESYSALWKILRGIGPKANKYKSSKYLEWQVINTEKEVE